MEHTCNQNKDTEVENFLAVVVAVLVFFLGLQVVLAMSESIKAERINEALICFLFACSPIVSGHITKKYLENINKVSIWKKSFWVLPVLASCFSLFAFMIAFNFSYGVEALKLDGSKVKEMVTLMNVSQEWLRVGMLASILPIFVPISLFCKEVVSQVKVSGWQSLVK